MALVVRGLLAGLLALAACVVLPLALVAAWLVAVVDDTDRYVETVGPLATDPAVVAAAEETVTARTSAAVEDNLPVAVGGDLEQAVTTGVGAVVRSPAFRPAWEAANADAHRQLLAQLDDEASADDRDVVLDLGSVVDSALREVSGALPVQVTAPDVPVPVTVLSGAQVQQARDGYAALSAAGVLLPVVWVVLTVLALLVARRRGRVLALLGLGSVVTLLLGRLALVPLRDAAVASVPRADRDLSAVVLDAATADLVTAAYVAAGVALLVAVVGLVVGPRRAM